MHGTLPRPLTALVFALALGTALTAGQPMPASARAYHVAQQPRRVTLAQGQLMNLRPGLGLSDREAFSTTPLTAIAWSAARPSPRSPWAAPSRPSPTTSRAT